MKNSIKLLTAFVICASAGTGLGYFQSVKEESHRVPSSREKDIPRVTYDLLACPSEEEYRRIAKTLHLEVPAGVDVCTHEQHGKLARLFAYAENLQIHFPPDWAPELQSDLGNPLAYLARMSRKLAVDLSAPNMTAYTKPDEKSVYLGGQFFGLEPLEALAALVHEARHSSESDPGHETCRGGELPKFPGGCDKELNLDPKKAGAYSYDAAFYAAVGLYASDLHQTDRKHLLNLCLATISSRFNELPESLAQAFDLLAVLDEEGGVHLLHPFLNDPIPLALSFLKEGEKVERIEFNVKNNGLLLFTTEKRLFTWRAESGFERMFQKTLPENMPIFEAARARIPFEDYPYFNFLTSDNQLYYYRFQPRIRSFELAPYPIFRRTKDLFFPTISRFFMGLSERTLFLGKDGIFYLSPRFRGQLPFDPNRDLQVPGALWVQGTGGVVYESLYGINNDGRTRYATVEIIPGKDKDHSDAEVYSLKESSLQPPDGRMGKKIFEGINLRALLDDEGNLQIELYGSEHRSFWRKENGGKVVDFTILRKHMASRSFVPNKDQLNFINDCDMRIALPDPWLGVGIGLNKNGELVIGGTGDQRCLVAGPQKYHNIKFESGRAREKKRFRHERNNVFGEEPAYTQSILWVTGQDGVKKSLLPYDYR